MNTTETKIESTEPTATQRERASRELVKGLADNAAMREDADGLEQLLLTSSRRSAVLLAAAVHGMADVATGGELDDLVRDAIDLEQQYDDQDRAMTAKAALVRLGMSAFDAENVVNLCAERVRDQAGGGEAEIGGVQ